MIVSIVQFSEVLASKLVLTNSTLLIKKLTKADEGEYNCTGTNNVENFIGGVTSHSMYITIQVPPMITPANGQDRVVGLRKTNLTIGFDITESDPPVVKESIIWFFTNGSAELFLVENATGNQLILSPDHRSLTVTNITLYNKGWYTLAATNEAGTRNSTIYVDVHVIPQLKSTNGRFFTRNEEESVSFNCTADGIPLSNIIWRKNGQLLILDDTKTMVVIDVSDGFRSLDNHSMTQSESTLTINALTEADEGLYSCLADNQAGNPAVMETPYNLTIEKVTIAPLSPCESNPCLNGGTCANTQDTSQCKCTEEYTGHFCQTRVVIPVAPEIVTPPDNITAPFYESVELKCIATGNPQPTILWYKDNERLLDTVTDPSVLTISQLDLDDRGFYFCEASNSAGIELSRTVIVNIEDVVQYDVNIKLPSNFYSNGQEPEIDSSPEVKIVSLLEEINNQLAGSTVSTFASIFSIKLLDSSGINFSNSPEVIPVIVTLLIKNATSDNVEQELINEFSGVQEILQDHITFGAVERFDGCESNSTLIPSTSGNLDLAIVIVWPEVNIGTTAYVNCPCGNLSLTSEDVGASRYCSGDFTHGAMWDEPHVADCNFTDLARNICRIASLATAEEKVMGIAEFTEDASVLGEVEVSVSVIVLATATEDVSGNLNLTMSFLDVVDNLLSVDSATLQQSQAISNSSALLLVAVQSVAQDIPIPENSSMPVVITQSTFAVSVRALDPNEFDGLTFSASFGDQFLIHSGQIDSDSLSFTTIQQSTPTASISLPSNTFEKVGLMNSTRLIQSVYLTDSLFLRRNDTQRKVGSIVIEAGVANGGRIKGLNDPPVMLTFIKNQKIENGTDPVCSFWDQSLDDGYGDWSSEGCRRGESYSESDQQVICFCNHLTSFTVLLDVSPNFTSPSSTPLTEALSAVTYIGCIVSIVCLLLTVISYLSIKQLRESESGQLILGLCFALLGLYITFIVSAHSTKVAGLCVMASALLQYFFLAAFFVMAAEAINLYMKLVIVLGSGFQHYTLKAMVVSWVTPLLIVTFCCAPYHYSYSSEYFCRPSGLPFYIGMVAPFIAIYLLNWIIFVTIIASLAKKNWRYIIKQKDSSQHGIAGHQQFLIAVALSVLFGLGWGIGLFVSGDFHENLVTKNILAVLFVVTTSFQGLLIFIMHGIRSKDIRNKWRAVFNTMSQRQNTISSTVSKFDRSKKSFGISGHTGSSYHSSTLTHSVEKGGLSFELQSVQTSTFKTEEKLVHVAEKVELQVEIQDHDYSLDPALEKHEPDSLEKKDSTLCSSINILAVPDANEDDEVDLAQKESLPLGVTTKDDSIPFQNETKMPCFEKKQLCDEVNPSGVDASL